MKEKIDLSCRFDISEVRRDSRLIGISITKIGRLIISLNVSSSSDEDSPFFKEIYFTVV